VDRIGIDVVGEQPDERVASLVPERVRWHRLTSILGEQRRERPDIRSVVSVHEAAKHRALLVGGRLGGRPFDAPRRQLGPHPSPRPLKTAVDRGNGRLQQRRRLVRRPPVRIAEDEDGTLPRRQVLDGGEVSELDRLSRHDHRFRPGLFGAASSSRRSGYGSSQGEICRQRVEIRSLIRVEAPARVRRSDVGNEDASW
jgi:hypothetical protein